ncbi:hypothetical protein [Anaplasma marginale]|nr:hypothetical protein [Anaplasma marginale]
MGKPNQEGVRHDWAVVASQSLLCRNEEGLAKDTNAVKSALVNGAR